MQLLCAQGCAITKLLFCTVLLRLVYTHTNDIVLLRDLESINDGGEMHNADG